jgi:hypothetical protein
LRRNHHIDETVVGKTVLAFVSIPYSEHYCSATDR